MNKVTPILPADFWPLTPFEAGCIVSGGSFRDEREWDRAAFVASWVVNVSGKSVKEMVTPNKLLGRKDKIVPRDPVAEKLEQESRLKAWMEKLAREQGD